jgi:hypothetical protein
MRRLRIPSSYCGTKILANGGSGIGLGPIFLVEIGEASVSAWATAARRSDHSASSPSRACSNACCGETLDTTTQELRRLCPLFADRAQEDDKQMGLRGTG